ncbi:putative aquaporin NIP6-1 isoform X1 [Sesbania bispinosa]|nr:putative aquaporin NIP6-1 isoform X1 [Sesbania bispinosa]
MACASHENPFREKVLKVQLNPTGAVKSQVEAEATLKPISISGMACICHENPLGGRVHRKFILFAGTPTAIVNQKRQDSETLIGRAATSPVLISTLLFELCIIKNYELYV